MSFIIAIDGTAGTGKGTISERISKELGFMNIDTGAMYRCVALSMINENIKLEDIDKIEEILKNIKIELIKKDNRNIVLLNNKDVTEEIRSKKVDDFVSPVSSIKIVRYKLVELQREIAKDKNVVMDGRDIGTYVFPNADVKIYLDADLEERVKRRIKQKEEKGINCSNEEVMKNIKDRDKNDKGKEMGALKIADDAIKIDTTEMSIEEVWNKVKDIIEEKKEKIDIKQNKSKKKKSIEKKSLWFRFQRTIVFHTLIFLYKLVYRTKTINQDNIPDEGSFILCGNHVSFMKVPVIVVFTKRKVKFIAKEELFKNLFLKWLGYLFEAIPVKRGKQDLESMKKSLKVLSSGEILGLFPEGTRNGIKKNVKIKNGAAYMSIKTGVPIIPVGIKTTKAPFPKIILNYGKPLDYSEYKGKTSDKEMLDKISTEIMGNIIKLTNEAV